MGGIFPQKFFQNFLDNFPIKFFLPNYFYDGIIPPFDAPNTHMGRGDTPPGGGVGGIYGGMGGCLDKKPPCK